MKIIINEQHSLLEEQKKLLDKKGIWEIVSIPATGLKLSQLKKLANKLKGEKIIFCSPIPALIKLLKNENFFVFHNDKREKKQLNGKTTMVVAKKGWKLI